MGWIFEKLFGLERPKEKPQEDKRDWLDDLIMMDEIFGDEED